MNQSKTRTRQQWLKWYTSGAIKQPEFPEGALTVRAICTHHAGPAEGFQTLDLGSQVVSSGPGWRSLEPLCSIIVPSNRRFEIGKILSRIPGNSVPVEFFFPAEPVTEGGRDPFIGDNSTELTDAQKMRSELMAKLKQQPVTSDKVTSIEKQDGWTQEEVEVFVALNTECEQLPRLPRRLIVFKILDSESIRTLLGHSNFTSKETDHGKRWD